MNGFLEFFEEDVLFLCQSGIFIWGSSLASPRKVLCPGSVNGSAEEVSSPLIRCRILFGPGRSRPVQQKDADGFLGVSGAGSFFAGVSHLPAPTESRSPIETYNVGPFPDL